LLITARSAEQQHPQPRPLKAAAGERPTHILLLSQQRDTL
jgi:hypothetical protein